VPAFKAVFRRLQIWRGSYGFLDDVHERTTLGECNGSARAAELRVLQVVVAAGATGRSAFLSTMVTWRSYVRRSRMSIRQTTELEPQAD
jgi:hypothetical protein